MDETQVRRGRPPADASSGAAPAGATATSGAARPSQAPSSSSSSSSASASSSSSTTFSSTFSSSSSSTSSSSSALPSSTASTLPPGASLPRAASEPKSVSMAAGAATTSAATPPSSSSPSTSHPSHSASTGHDAGAATSSASSSVPSHTSSAPSAPPASPSPPPAAAPAAPESEHPPSPSVRLKTPPDATPDAATSAAAAATSPPKSSSRRKHSSGSMHHRKPKKQRSRERLEHELDVKEERQQRVKLVNELLETEKAHVQAIDVVVNNYLFPLRNIETDILPPSTVQDIFSNLELIRNWHRTFLSQLTAHLQLGETFGSLFLDMVPVLRQLYTQYNENYDHAMDSYEKAKKSKAFSAFLEKKQAELNDSKALLTYLYLPIQRMIAYDSLLKDIVRRTPPDHEDFKDLSTALRALRDIQQNAQRRAKQRKNIDKVIEIQNRIAGTTQLALPHRRYVYEGRILFIGSAGSSSSKRYCYLFNDLFVCCKDKKKVLEVDFKEPLGTLKVEDMPDTEDFRYLFRLTSSANEYVLSTEDKYHWMALISQYVNVLRTDTSHVDEDEETHSREDLASLIVQWAKDENSTRVHEAVRAVAAEILRGK